MVEGCLSGNTKWPPLEPSARPPITTKGDGLDQIHASMYTVMLNRACFGAPTATLPIQEHRSSDDVPQLSRADYFRIIYRVSRPVQQTMDDPSPRDDHGIHSLIATFEPPSVLWATHILKVMMYFILNSFALRRSSSSIVISNHGTDPFHNAYFRKDFPRNPIPCFRSSLSTLSKPKTIRRWSYKSIASSLIEHLARIILKANNIHPAAARGPFSLSHLS